VATVSEEPVVRDRGASKSRPEKSNNRTVKTERRRQMAENPKEVVRRFWEEVYGGGDIEALDELLSPYYRIHDLTNRMEYGIESLQGVISGIRGSVPGAEVRLEDQVAAEEDKVVTRFTVHVRLRDGVATDQEPEPGDEELELNGMSISRVSAGKIAESWVLWESLLAEQKISPGDQEWRWPPWRW
jgi:hypothetical protein